MKPFNKNEYNKSCAFFLGWTYISSIDIKKGSYHTSIKAGWYTKVPKVLALGLTQHLYKGRGHTSLKFDSDWNWIHEVCQAINKTQNPKQGGDTTHSTLKREIQALLSKSAKEAVVKAIWNFLNWHNENRTV